MKYRDKIIAYLDTIEPGTVLNLNGLYEKQFYKMSQAAFFKAMERLVTDGILLRAAKGMYVKAGSPKEAQEAVLNYYFGENNDMECTSGIICITSMESRKKKVMLSNSIPIK